ncbi:hypothetical protein JCM1840_000287 [Sporobolomyces johnsonii]
MASLDEAAVWSTPETAQSPSHQPASDLPLAPSGSGAMSSDPTDIWATVPSAASSSQSGYRASYAIPPPAAPPPFAPSSSSGPSASLNLDDLDPFSPTSSQPFAFAQSNNPTATPSPDAFSQIMGKTAPAARSQTLGSVVKKDSRLIVIDNSDSDQGDEASTPTEEKGQAELGKAGLPGGSGGGGGGGFSFGGMFRSISGTPSKGKDAQRDGPPAAAGSDSRPSTPTRPPPPGPSSIPIPSAPSSSSVPSPFSNPLASIASVFRPSPASSASGTPQPGSSPTQREKGAFITAIAGSGAAAGASAAKGKEKEKEAEVTSEKEPGEGENADGLAEKGARPPQKKDEPAFDFNKFLEQMRTRSADPIAKYLRSFLKEFSRRPPVSVNDQVRVINDFLDFIATKMRAVDPWKTMILEEARKGPEGAERAEAEFDLAMEAMEKLVMNRLWHLTFTPALDLSRFPAGMSPSGDVERDHVVSQRIRLFAWIQPKHLDLPIPSPSSAPSSPSTSSPTASSSPSSSPAPAPTAEESPSDTSTPRPATPRSKDKDGAKQINGFVDFAARELRKMNQYKAPRDKLICVLNCCKVIFGLIRHVATGEEGADTFIPLLIYVVLQANPDHLVSNLQYIQRFRNPEKLAGEGGYYLSSLNAAISFIESLDATSLSNITQLEFEHHVAAAVKQLAAEEPPPPPPSRPRDSSRPSTPSDPAHAIASSPTRPALGHPPSPTADLSSTAHQSPDETSSASLLPSSSVAEGSVPPNLSFPSSTKALLLRGTDSVERAMSKPIGALARIFEQLEVTANELTGQTPPPAQQVPGGGGGRPSAVKRRSYVAGYPQTSPTPSLSPFGPSSSSAGSSFSPNLSAPPSPDPALYAPPTISDASVTVEIDRQHEAQRQAALETLESVFPDVEHEVLEMVLLSNGGDVGRTVESLLEMAE